MSKQYYHLLPTDLGWVGILASSKGLRKIVLKQSPEEALEGLGLGASEVEEAENELEETGELLKAYFRGEPVSLESISVDLDGAPPFFRTAWEACRAIPRGETRSYGWLAAAAGSPRAVRAAGQAMAHNPLAFVVPCHRVVASDGSLHGYGGGLDQKAGLLELERHV